jgi:hypothetical protein
MLRRVRQREDVRRLPVGLSRGGYGYAAGQSHRVTDETANFGHPVILRHWHKLWHASSDDDAFQEISL